MCRLPGRALVNRRHVWHCATGELNSRVFLRATIAQVILNPCLLADRSSRLSFCRVKGINVQARLHHFLYIYYPHWDSKLWEYHSWLCHIWLLSRCQSGWINLNSCSVFSPSDFLSLWSRTLVSLDMISEFFLPVTLFYYRRGTDSSC